ncbi:MAG: sigma-70 family RNA polymerase sigma factor [Isosphaeraceae bacterium]
MASGVINRVALRVERGHLDSVGATASDESLLQDFFDSHPEISETAFRSLVTRHGPMVMGVCRHVLNHDEDAEDAFQATFLTLARKAETIREPRLLSAWLYEVAYRIAIRARSNAARRRDQEKRGAAMASMTESPRHEHEAAWAELRPVLHDELNRLPEKYRLPIILSYLEGRTNEEVASLLRWPVGTVKGRLSRARDLLRSRLLRRGLVLSAAFLCSALSHGVVFAEYVPESLVDRTVRISLGRSPAMPSPRADSTGPDAAEAGPGEFSRAEQLFRSVDPRKPRRAWTTPALAAMVIAIVTAALFILSDPFLTKRVKQSAVLLTIRAARAASCHE